MKAKFVNEKFTDYSDPIKDMGIGEIEVNFKKMYNDIKPIQNLQKWVDYISSFNGKIISGRFIKNKSKKILFNKFKIKEVSSRNYGDEIYFYDENLNYFCVVKSENYAISRSIKECINEKFNDDTDPIKDMGIGGFITNKREIISMYNGNVSGYYLTYNNYLRAYHPNSKKPLWDFADEHEGLNKNNKSLVHWRIIDLYMGIRSGVIEK